MNKHFLNLAEKTFPEPYSSTVLSFVCAAGCASGFALQIAGGFRKAQHGSALSLLDDLAAE
jgi:hypothetical protein